VSIETLGLLVIACLAINLSPGPSILLVTSISAAHGLKPAIFVILGMNTGAFVHIILAASGVAALLAASPLVFALIQYLGAGYLIYLGFNLWRSASSNSVATGYTEQEVRDASAWRYFRRGLLVDLLNPKIALFLLAFILQFLHSVESPGFLVSVALGSVFLVTGVIVNSSIACVTALGARRAGGRNSQWIQRRIPAAVLVFLGLRLLWQDG
jgi:threonine/homoserine/homoserine lactone efflux protein